MIQVNNLFFGYKKQDILHDISIQISIGSLTALIGTNGAGKSTLMKLMVRLLSPQSGSININEVPLSRYPIKQLAQTVAYVPQHQNIVFDFSVWDMVMNGRYPWQSAWCGESRIDKEKVEHVLEQCHLIHLKDRMLTQLSGGELQRVHIARSFAQDTPVLLLDEPLAGLDIAHQHDIMDILVHRQQQEKTTILVVLHDLTMVKQYCPQIILLKAGKMIYHGSTDSLSHDTLREGFDLSRLQIHSRWDVSRTPLLI
ncbi:MAG: ABC transporter ATP-binding protein [Bacteroidales bacterium]|jgi:iron complex transport system ATP-binding protein|nr:ABC transporter ATP-binding protein [Bacteroidales bacterium]